jgi:hypothetical protein
MANGKWKMAKQAGALALAVWVGGIVGMRGQPVSQVPLTPFSIQLLQATGQTNAWAVLGLSVSNQVEVTNWITRIPFRAVGATNLTVEVTNAWRLDATNAAAAAAAALGSVVTNGQTNVTLNGSTLHTNAFTEWADTADNGPIPVKAENLRFFDQDDRLNFVIYQDYLKGIWATEVGGGGGGLSNLSASALSAGTVPVARLSGITSNQMDAGSWQVATQLVSVAAGDRMSVAQTGHVYTVHAADQGLSPNAGTLNLIFEGSSSSEEQSRIGWSAPPRATYPLYLRGLWTNTIYSWTNYAQGGHNMDMITNRLASVLADRSLTRTNVLFFQGGANDWVVGNSLANFTNSYNTYCSNVQAAGIKVVALTLTKRFDYPASYAYWTQYNAFIRTCPFVDKVVDVGAVWNTGPTSDTNLCYDLTHPNTNGAIAQADIINTNILLPMAVPSSWGPIVVTAPLSWPILHAMTSNPTVTLGQVTNIAGFSFGFEATEFIGAANGDIVTNTWHDVGPNQWDAYYSVDGSVGTPVYSNNAFGAGPGIMCSPGGAGPVYYMNSNSLAWSSNMTSCTLVAPVEMMGAADASSYSTIFSAAIPAGSYRVGFSATGITNMGVRVKVDEVTGQNTFPNVPAKVTLTAVINFTNAPLGYVLIYTNGALCVSNPLTASDALVGTNALFHGIFRGGGGTAWNGVIGALFGWDRELGAADLATVWSYLDAKYTTR